MKENLWQIYGVPIATRRTIKAFAAKHGVSIAEALVKLVEDGENYQAIKSSEVVVKK